MTCRRVCALESSSGFPIWVNWLNKNSYFLLCPTLLINYKYCHCYIPSHNRIISKLFWVITVESTYMRAISWTNSSWSDHKSDTTLSWMLKHMTGWWMVQKRFYKASLSWSRKTEQESLQMFKSHHFFHCPAPRHPTAAVVSAAQPQGCSGWLPTHQPNIPCAQV